MAHEEGKRLGGLLLLLALAGCSRTGVQHVGPAQLSVDPPTIDFGLAWVGHPQTGIVTIHNGGQIEGGGTITVVGNFSVDATGFDVPAGGDTPIRVTYAPDHEGHDVGRLDLGTLHVALSGDARVMPVCTAAPCRDVSFDTLSRSCVSTFSADGTACQTACTSGSCQSGACLGTFDTCDDGDACTVELCSETTGCSHAPLQCPAPADPCQAPSCDSKTGCTTTFAADGTSCGPDDCTATTLPVCIGGQCVARQRPVGTRCGNTFVEPVMPSWGGGASAYDSDRQVVVVVGGDAVNGTWEWDGSSWTQRRLTAPAPQNWGAAMIYDRARKRMVLFGDWETNQTWEYDGASWYQVFPAHSPPARMMSGFSYDRDRQVAVLFGGVGNGYYSQVNDTWEYDGVDWTQKFPSSAPSVRGGNAMAYDAARKKTLLFGGGTDSNMPNGGTWEWDGVQWTQLSLSLEPANRGGQMMVYDSGRQRVVLYGGNLGNNAGADTWEWDGSAWTEVLVTSPPGARGAVGAAYDEARQQTVMLGGDGSADTWLWDGISWKSADPNGVPLPRSSAGMAYDSARQRTVMFGGSEDFGTVPNGITWEWDGVAWKSVATGGPPPRLDAPMAFDSARQVTVLFGGCSDQSGDLGDTWEWDGTAWAQRTPAHSPPARCGHALAYDSVRHKTVLFGGTLLNAEYDPVFADTWEWDGTDWTQSMPSVSPPGRTDAAMVYDAARQRIVLFGGLFSGQVSGPMGNDFNDTWLWDGVQWTQASPATSPSARDKASIAYDTLRARVLMFGGVSWYDSNDELWQWDGTQWTLLSPNGSRSAYCGAAMAYDQARDDFVMFGGAWSSEGLTSDTWLYIPN